MLKKIIINNKEINYREKKSQKSRNLRIVVSCISGITVSAPYFFNDEIIENFIKKKANWIFNKLNYFNNLKNNIIYLPKHNYFIEKIKCYNLILNKINEINKNYNFKFNKIKVKRQKSRWGSCSKKRNLNFNYKIVFLPEKLRDYIIIHELCHLQELNHSKKFWELVGKTIPEYKSIRSELKKISIK